MACHCSRHFTSIISKLNNFLLHFSGPYFHGSSNFTSFNPKFIMSSKLLQLWIYMEFFAMKKKKNPKSTHYF